MATKKTEPKPEIVDEIEPEMVEQGHSVAQIEEATSPETHPEMYDEFGNPFKSGF